VVMKGNMMHKNLRQTIVRSLGRYIAIVAIIAAAAIAEIILLNFIRIPPKKIFDSILLPAYSQFNYKSFARLLISYS